MSRHRKLALTKLSRCPLPFCRGRDLAAQPEQTLRTFGGEPSGAEFKESPV